MLVMQLRKCCNHPYLFPGAEPGFDGVSTGPPHLTLSLVLDDDITFNPIKSGSKGCRQLSIR